MPEAIWRIVELLSNHLKDSHRVLKILIDDSTIRGNRLERFKQNHYLVLLGFFGRPEDPRRVRGICIPTTFDQAETFPQHVSAMRSSNIRSY